MWPPCARASPPAKPSGMALVESQLADKGTRLEIFEDECNGVRLYARVIDMPFYDPKGERMKN
jgi:sarcosine oxidase subunit alpha